MLLSDYQIKSRTTAIYPNLGNNLIYPTLGLCGECGETIEKIILYPYKTNDILKELGDVLWYASQICSELQFDLEDIYESSSSFILNNNLKFEEAMIMHASHIAETVKKIIRDGNNDCDEKSRSKIEESLIILIYCLEGLAEDHDSCIEDIADLNIFKLLNRKKNGNISGSGDDR